MKEDCRGSLQETWYEPEIILHYVQRSQVVILYSQLQSYQRWIDSELLSNSTVEVRYPTQAILPMLRLRFSWTQSHKDFKKDKIHRKVREMELKEGITGWINLTSCVEIEMLQLLTLDLWLETQWTIMLTTINNQINSYSSSWVEFPVYDDRCEDNSQASQARRLEQNHKNNSTLRAISSVLYYLRMLCPWLAVRSQLWLGAAVQLPA